MNATNEQHDAQGADENAGGQTGGSATEQTSGGTTGQDATEHVDERAAGQAGAEQNASRQADRSAAGQGASGQDTTEPSAAGQDMAGHSDERAAGQAGGGATGQDDEHAGAEQGQQGRREQGPAAARYIAPDRQTRRINKVIAGLARIGVPVKGSYVLYVRGRTSGEWRTTPVDFFEFEGARYLVAPRGVTQWVRNLRAAGEGRLRAGRRDVAFTAVELPDDAKERILRAYIKKWSAEIDTFFGGVHPDAPSEDLARIAPNHPVFRLTLKK